MEENYYQYRNFSVPKPLDSSLLSIQLRTESNYVGDGFNVLLSADAGISRVNIDLEGTRLSVLCSVSQFEVNLSFPNCDIEYGKDFATNRASNTLSLNLSETIDQNTTSGLELAATLDTSSGKAALTGKHGKNSKSSTRAFVEQNAGYLRHFSPGKVSYQHPTNGTLNISFPEYEGWFARPTAIGKPMAVTATAGVRQEWINFEETEVTQLGRWGRKIQKLFLGDEPQQVRDQELFNRLLGYLVKIKLQDPENAQLATLAGDAMIFIPETERMAAVLGPSQDDALELPPRLINEFLAASSQTRLKMVESIVSADPNNESPTQANSKAKPAGNRGDFIAPSGTVPNAISAMEALEKDSPDQIYPTEDLYRRFGENTVRDLRGLGFLSSRGVGIGQQKFIRFSGSAEKALLAEVVRKRTFSVAIDLLQDNIRLSGRQIGEAISDELGKHWVPSSAQRYGQNIKKWLVLLFPNFSPVDEGDDDYHYVASLQSESPEKGRGGYINAEVRSKIVELVLKGNPYNKAGEQIGITNPMVIYNNRKKHPDLWRIEIEKQSQ